MSNFTQLLSFWADRAYVIMSAIKFQGKQPSPAPIIERRYEHSRVARLLRQEIARTGVTAPYVGSIRSFRADLDNDGAVDDLAGTAILQVGRRFRSFIFLMREDGAIRLLENNGQLFNPASRGRPIHCALRARACPDPMLRAIARRQLPRARFSITEYDADRPGLEVVIRLTGGAYAIWNSLDLFSS